MDCVNEDESLFDMIRAKKAIKAKITIAQLSGKVGEIPAMKKEYAVISSKIKTLEASAKTGDVCIRLM